MSTMIKCGHCKGGHETVAEVRACSTSGHAGKWDIFTGENLWAAPDSKTHLQMKEAAEDQQVAQFKYLRDEVFRLLNVKEGEPRYMTQVARYSEANSATIHGLETAVARLSQFHDKRRGGPVTRDGIYQTPDGKIWKVQWNKASGSGSQLYAKRWDGTGYTYAPGAIRQLKDTDRLSLEALAALGRDADGPMYGKCGKCGRDLTDEESIAAGIGPICAGKYEA